jgi:hypothetical protein
MVSLAQQSQLLADNLHITNPAARAVLAQNLRNIDPAQLARFNQEYVLSIRQAPNDPTRAAAALNCSDMAGGYPNRTMTTDRNFGRTLTAAIDAAARHDPSFIGTPEGRRVMMQNEAMRVQIQQVYTQGRVATRNTNPDFSRLTELAALGRQEVPTTVAASEPQPRSSGFNLISSAAAATLTPTNDPASATTTPITVATSVTAAARRSSGTAREATAPHAGRPAPSRGNHRSAIPSQPLTTTDLNDASAVLAQQLGGDRTLASQTREGQRARDTIEAIDHKTGGSAAIGRIFNGLNGRSITP